MVLIFSVMNFYNNTVRAITCVKPDWNDDLCKLPESTGTRCLNLQSFKMICTNSTVGCESIPGGCFGSVPPGHWYPVYESAGTVSSRCRCGCFADQTKFGIFGDFTGRDLIEANSTNEFRDDVETQSLSDYDSSQLIPNKINGLLYSKQGENALKVVAGTHKIILSDSHPVVIGDSLGQITKLVTASKVQKGDLLLDAERKPVEVMEIKK